MSAATTILFAREDLSIPGAVQAGALPGEAGAVEAHFFELVDGNKPDIIVLDFSRAPGAGAETIAYVRRRTEVPILAVCSPEPRLADQYRIAGAAACIPAPADIVALNRAVQKIGRIRGHGSVLRTAPESFTFARLSFDPNRHTLAGEGGSRVALTSSESRLLAHLATRARQLCTPAEISRLLYGPEHNVGASAVDVVVNRLRKKLASAGGVSAAQLIKTELRRGYRFDTEVAAA